MASPQWITLNDHFASQRRELVIDGKPGFVFLPDPPRPWVWYAPTRTGAHPDESHIWLVSRLLANGIAFAGLDIGESFGNPAGRAAFTQFHSHLVSEFGLSPKPCLLPQSRGGLMHYNWAVEHPDLVQAIAGIFTVCNISAWPGPAAAPAYGVTEAEFVAMPKDNPIERLAPLAAARVPILHIHGDSDKLIPLEDHTAELARRYRALGGEMEIIVVPGRGHEVCDELFQDQRFLDFLLAQSHAG